MIQSLIGSVVLFLLLTLVLIGTTNPYRRGGGGHGGGRFGGGHSGGGRRPYHQNPNWSPGSFDYDSHGMGNEEIGCPRPSFTDNAKFEMEDCRNNMRQNYCSNAGSLVPPGKNGVLTCLKGRRLLRLTSSCSSEGIWIPALVENCDALFILLTKYKGNSQTSIQEYDPDSSGTTQGQCSKVIIQKSGSNILVYCFSPGSGESDPNADNCADSFSSGAPNGAKVGLKCRPPFRPVDNTVSEMTCTNGQWMGSLKKIMCDYWSDDNEGSDTTSNPNPPTSLQTTTPSPQRSCPKVIVKQRNSNFLISCSVPGQTLADSNIDNCMESLANRVPSGTIISLKCRPPSISSLQSNELFCRDGEWTGQLKKPECVPSTGGSGSDWSKPKETPSVNPSSSRPIPPATVIIPGQDKRPTPSTHQATTVTCPLLKRKSAGVQLTCVFDGGNGVHTNDCNIRLPVGTEAKYACAQYYEANTALPTLYRKCKEDGTWSGNSDFTCIVECGRENVLKTPFITHGSPTLRGQWPWHAGIFRNSSRDNERWEYICGATLLSKRALITAGHCVTMLQTSKTVEGIDLQIHLGKYRREDNDENVQIKELGKVVLNPNYNPYNYDSDLAILILKTEVTIGYFVRPVCFVSTSDSALEDLQLADNSIGTVVGWGYDENHNLADELRMARLRVVGSRECAKGMLGSSITQLSARSTTFCAGFNNGTNVCNGDSGSGMFFPTKDADNTKWYIQGLVSVGIAHEDGKCKPEEVSVFTRLGRYADFITKTLSEHDAI